MFTMWWDRSKRWLASKPAICLGSIAIGVVVCSFADIQNVEIDPSGGVNLTTRTPNDVAYLQTAWEDADRRAILVSVLAERGLFLADDIRLVEAITNICDPIQLEPLDAHLAAAQACAEQLVPARLRALARQGDPPFHPAGSIVRIGVPEDQPPIGTANACQNGAWYRRRIELANIRDGRTVIVFASGHYGRGVCGVGTADLQLNAEDALAILDSPLDTFEEAVATIVN